MSEPLSLEELKDLENPPWCQHCRWQYPPKFLRAVRELIAIRKNEAHAILEAALTGLEAALTGASKNEGIIPQQSEEAPQYAGPLSHDRHERLRKAAEAAVKTYFDGDEMADAILELEAALAEPPGRADGA